MKKGILIGIAGASGSGKTLVANNILDNIGSDKAVLIQEDSYYKDLSDMPFDERKAMNFDHPHAFDYDLLVEDLTRLANGEKTAHPVYDYKNHIRMKKTKTVGPGDLIIIEGILIFNNAALRELMDLRVFVDTALDICFIRRLKRDITERGRTVDSVIWQYRETVRPMYFRFIEPSKQYADIIVPRGGKNTVAIDLLTTRINAMLDDNCQ